MPEHSNDSLSDGELVALCNSGDPRTAAPAFETLYRRHRDFVLRVAMRFSRDREIALDTLQETFSYLLKKFPPTGGGLELSARLTTLLYPVAKNVAISALRKSRRFEAAEIEPDQLPAAPSEHGDTLDRALAGLSGAHREVLILRFVDDLSLNDIAMALGIPAGTVKSRLHLAIRQLKNDPAIKDLFER